MAKKSRKVAQLLSELASLRELFTQRELKELRQELARMRMDFAILASKSAYAGRDAGQIDVQRDAGQAGMQRDASQAGMQRYVGQAGTSRYAGQNDVRKDAGQNDVRKDAGQSEKQRSS